MAPAGAAPIEGLGIAPEAQKPGMHLVDGRGVKKDLRQARFIVGLGVWGKGLGLDQRLSATGTMEASEGL